MVMRCWLEEKLIIRTQQSRHPRHLHHRLPMQRCCRCLGGWGCDDPQPQARGYDYVAHRRRQDRPPCEPASGQERLCRKEEGPLTNKPMEGSTYGAGRMRGIIDEDEAAHLNQLIKFNNICSIGQHGGRHLGGSCHTAEAL